MLKKEGKINENLQLGGLSHQAVIEDRCKALIRHELVLLDRIGARVLLENAQ